MRNCILYILGAKKGFAPVNWTLATYTGFQRLYYIKGGRGRILLDDRNVLPFETNKLYLMPTGMRHCFETDPDDPIDHVYIDFFSTPPLVSDRPICYDLPDNSPLAHQAALMDSLIHIREDPDYAYPLDFGQISGAAPGSHEELLQIVYELLYTTLLLMSHERPLPFIDDDIVIDTLDFIQSHYAEPISVEQLAEQAGFNPIYFIRRFKKVMSITPYAYLRSYRLLRAKELLTSGETYASAAERVGYQNAVSLYNALRQKPEEPYR